MVGHQTFFAEFWPEDTAISEWFNFDLRGVVVQWQGTRLFKQNFGQKIHPFLLLFCFQEKGDEVPARNTHTHLFNGPFSGTTQVSLYQKGGTNLDFTEARDSEWQWHQLGQMQVCTLLQTDNHTSIPPLSFLQARCPSCRPTNSIKALKALLKNSH